MARFGSGGSGVVNTAWAMLALLAANCDDAEALRRGAAYLMSEQLPNGDWKQEGPNPNPNPSPARTLTGAPRSRLGRACERAALLSTARAPR